MDSELPANDHHPRRRVPLFNPNHRKRATPLARKRRLYQLCRELAHDLGFDPDAVTLSERAVLHQAGTLLLQVELAQKQLIDSALIDADTCIRLTSEARRLLAGLRSRAPEAKPQGTLGPLRRKLLHKSVEVEAVTDVVADCEEEPAT
jgi:hypothetical protein